MWITCFDFSVAPSCPYVYSLPQCHQDTHLLRLTSPGSFSWESWRCWTSSQAASVTTANSSPKCELEPDQQARPLSCCPELKRSLGETGKLTALGNVYRPEIIYLFVLFSACLWRLIKLWKVKPSVRFIFSTFFPHCQYFHAGRQVIVNRGVRNLWNAILGSGNLQAVKLILQGSEVDRTHYLLNAIFSARKSWWLKAKHSSIFLSFYIHIYVYKCIYMYI